MIIEKVRMIITMVRIKKQVGGNHDQDCKDQRLEGQYDDHNCEDHNPIGEYHNQDGGDHNLEGEDDDHNGEDQKLVG